MSRTITVSLPVADLTASKACYTALGFVNNPQFTDDVAAFMAWSDSINLVLLTYEKRRTFATRRIPPNTSSEVALPLSCDSRREDRPPSPANDAMKVLFEQGDAP